MCVGRIFLSIFMEPEMQSFSNLNSPKQRFYFYQYGVFTIVLFIFAIPTIGNAEALCKGSTKDLKLLVSEHSDCGTGICILKVENDQIKFEITPPVCESGATQYRFSVNTSRSKMRATISCDGNAICPDKFNSQGVAEVLSSGKTWGSVSAVKIKK
jgi:hypothetical protein